MKTTWKHVVRIFDAKTGKMIREDYHMHADDAYDDYVCILNDLKKMDKILREKFPTIVTRYNDNRLMTMEIVD